MSQCSTCNWWLRSPNASNTTNFCNVNTNGNANNNNAYNSNGFAPGFCLPSTEGRVEQSNSPRPKRSRAQVKYDPYAKGEVLPARVGYTAHDPKLLSDDPARTLLAWRGTVLSPFHVPGQSRLAARQYHIYTEGENFYYDGK